MESIRDELHGTARLQVHLARMGGYTIDKQLMRFNDIVEAAMQYGKMSFVFRPDLAREMIYETPEICIKEMPEYTGKPFDRKAYQWMEFCDA
jgi:hypothetical protein